MDSLMKTEKSGSSDKNESARAFVTPRKTRVTPSRAFVSGDAADGHNVLKRHHTHPVIGDKTTPGSNSRLEAIQRALTTPIATPTRSKRNNRVVIVSSDEEDATDIESNVNPPMRSVSFQGQFPSSQSSSDPLFPPLSIGSSTYYSLGTSVSKLQIKDVSNNSHLTAKPITVQDVFDPVPGPLYSSVDSSPNRASLSQSVLHFARSPFGTDLEVIIIAHSHEAQKILDDNQISWGVQYEIARGICSGLWTWNGIESQLRLLKGRDSEAAFRVEKVMKGRDSPKPSDMHIWRQLDLEQDAILENIDRGLGLMGDFQGVRDWYGGRIQQIGRVMKEGGSYKIRLEKMESRRSHRFARYYGSRRFLHIRVSEELLHKEREEVKRFFRRKFILCGRVFVAFHAKEKNVYLVETDENYDRSAQNFCGDHLRKSFNSFINWHNPLEVVKNTKQVITKYTARFALGLSNSKPALEFEERNILFIEDITAEDWPQGKKGAPADKLMTDGCGFLNHAALQAIVQTVGYNSIPAGIQGRIDGSKGFFILHPTDTASEPKIWIRDSQNKIENKSFDRAHRILDLLCASQPSPPAALTQQSILNLFANGVEAELLVQLMEQGLEEEVAPLLQWDKPHATLSLHDAISKCGGVSRLRSQRVAYSLSRVLGFTGRDWHDDDGLNDEDDDDDDEERGVFTGRNEYSGAPLALHEVAIELLQSGFDPRENKLLQEKIQKIIDTIIKTSVEKYRIPVPESAMSFIVPDPLGILEEGQVFYRFSRPRKDPETDLLHYALEGDILVGRYPIRLPSDIQRVNAVYRRELDRWPDVLVVSVKGNRSLASLLADGDMDGDEAIIIYNQKIVNLFKNRSFTEPPKDFIRNNFKRDVKSVEQFGDQISGVSTRHAHEAFQDVLVSNLSESIVGLYSMMHENACLRYGYDSNEAIRLAYVFATLLDSSKNGCRLKDGLFWRDKNVFGSKSSVPYNIRAGERDILAILKFAGENKGTQLQQKYRDHGQIDEWVTTDDALLTPSFNAITIARKYSTRGFKDYAEEFSRIEHHVQAAYDEYLRIMKAYFGKKEKKTPNKSVKKSRREKQEDLMLPCAKLFAEVIPGIELIQNVEEVKASCAYARNPKFAFHVAFRRLCLLKAESKPGGLVPSLRIFDEAKKVSSSFLKALQWADEDHLESAPFR